MIADLPKEITILLADVLQYNNYVTNDSGNGLIVYIWLSTSHES